MINKPFVLGFAYASAVFLIAILYWDWSQSRNREQSITLYPAENALRGHQEREPVARAAHAADTLKSDAAILALQRKVDSLTARLSTQAPKAQQSAQEFQKTPTFDNCVQALNDCQEESETQRYALAVQDRMLAAADSAKRKARKEIARSYAVNDSVMTGWQDANKALRVEKGKKWALTVQAGYGIGPNGAQPNVSIGVSRIIKRF